MTKLFDLSGKRALVTGGGRGLGRGMAEGLAEAGAKVVILGSSGAVMKAAEEMRAKGLDVTGLQGDLSDRAGIPAVFGKADYAAEVAAIRAAAAAGWESR